MLFDTVANVVPNKIYYPAGNIKPLDECLAREIPGPTARFQKSSDTSGLEQAQGN
jgi:hypothetical protein